MKKIIFLFLITFSVMYADAPNACDVLAAESGNKSNLPGVVGVKIDKIDSIKAIEACMQAVKDFPNQSRYGYQLARAYFSNKSYKEGVEWHTKSAEQGHADAQYTMGIIYRWGIDVEKDDKKAFKWFMKAAEQGHTDAQNIIGEIYYDGLGVKKDYKEAFKWYMKAAENGDDGAQYLIGYMYFYGQWATKNYKKAFKWFMKAAEQGHIGAQTYIGEMYRDGKGVRRNNKEFFKWFMRAAKQGHIWSQSIIGFAYEGGKGVRKNSKESFKWFMRAAKKGHILSQAMLGTMYGMGIGTRKNYIEAYAWTSIALTGDIIDKKVIGDMTKELRELERKMTPQQIAIAQNYDPLKQNKNVEDKSDEKKIESLQRYTGTGFFIDKSKVLTNNHVVKNCKSIELIRNGYKSAAKIIAKDSINDLAILEAEKTNSSSLNFRAEKGIRIGDDIIVIGYPLGDLLGSGIKLTTGNVSALSGLVNDTTMLQFTAPVQAGNSGGALLDKSGNVVGIVVARLEKEQNVNLSIKSKVAQMFLDINNIDYGVAISKEKKDVADIADEAKESIVQVVCYP